MTDATRPRIAVHPPGDRSWLVEAVRDGGGEVVDLADAQAVVWTDPDAPDALRSTLDERPDLAWVQLPWAGIEPYLDVLDDDRTWTSGKGVYAAPVAEHALALGLAGLRGLDRYARADSWGEESGRNLVGAAVVILGGGAITRALLDLLEPFGAHVTVVRNRVEPLDGADRVVGVDGLHDALRDADLVVLALALTSETEGIIDADALDAMPSHCWLVNIARGAHVDSDALVAALRGGGIGGAALDVTDPEPLPDGHPLWGLALVTPHTANTPEMARPLLSDRVRENVRRFAAGESLLGVVDPELGY